MLRTKILTIVVCLVFIATSSQSHAATTDPYVPAHAQFSVNGDAMPMASVFVTQEDRPLYGPKYQWVTLNFYAFSLTKENIASANQGDMQPITQRTYGGTEITNASFYNHSNAKIILSIDSVNSQITQVDMSVPGYSCTVAWKPEDLKKFSQNFAYKKDGIKIKSKGSYSCELAGKPTLFAWDFSVDTPIFHAAKK